MVCPYVAAKFRGYSDEKKKVVLAALGGFISCPRCKTVHHLEEENTNVQH